MERKFPMQGIHEARIARMDNLLGNCGCRLERGEYGLKIADCSVHAAAHGLLRICQEFLPLIHALRCAIEGHGEAQRVMSLQTGDGIREIEDALRQIIAQAEGKGGKPCQLKEGQET